MATPVVNNTGGGLIDINVDISGDDLTAALAEAMKETFSSVVGPMVEEAETIKARSQEIVPLDLGPLRASADVVGINVEEQTGHAVVSFGYGGAAAHYSIIQHETPPSVFSHAPGRQWKYLEQPVMEAIDGMEGRLAARTAARLATGTGGTFDATS